MVRYIFVVIPSCVCIAVCGWPCSFAKSFDCFASVVFFFSSFFLRGRVLVQQKNNGDYLKRRSVERLGEHAGLCHEVYSCLLPNSLAKLGGIFVCDFICNCCLDFLSMFMCLGKMVGHEPHDDVFVMAI